MTSSYYPNSNEIEVFEEDLAENMAFLKANLQHVEGDLVFAENLCSWYDDKGRLSPKQMIYALRFWRSAKNNSPRSAAVVVQSKQAASQEPPKDTHGYTREQHARIAECWIELAAVYKKAGNLAQTQESMRNYAWHNEQARQMLKALADKAKKGDS